MEHEREDSMDDMIGSVGVPPSINVGHMNTRYHNFSKMSTSYTNALLENDHHQNLLEGMNMMSNSKPDHNQLPFVSPTTMTTSNSNVSASKRTLSSLYWNDDDVAAAGGSGTGTSSSNKRFNLESDANNQENNGTVANATSFATLLNQIPQTPSLHQQTMLGSINDGLLRTPFQIQGMNWYA